jgi:hypothetical protein
VCVCKREGEREILLGKWHLQGDSGALLARNEVWRQTSLLELPAAVAAASDRAPTNWNGSCLVAWCGDVPALKLGADFRKWTVEPELCDSLRCGTACRGRIGVAPPAPLVYAVRKVSSLAGRILGRCGRIIGSIVATAATEGRRLHFPDS